MVADSSNPDDRRLIPYAQATPIERMQALAHMMQSLQPRFPLFFPDTWVKVLNMCQPLLWKEAGTVEIEADTLLLMANWADHNLFTNYGPDEPRIYGAETRYLAKNLVYYTEQARELLARDPNFVSPSAAYELQALVYRLSAGNAIAEHIHRVSQWQGPPLAKRSARGATKTS